MTPAHTRRNSRGVITLFVAVIMLLLTTLLVAIAFKLSTINLMAVGNVQARTGSVAAAEKVIEEFISGEPGTAEFDGGTVAHVDINLDEVIDYVVEVPPPKCVRARRASSASASSVTLEGFSAAGAWNTRWEINALAIDEATGARVKVLHARRYVLTEAEKNALCP